LISIISYKVSYTCNRISVLMFIVLASTAVVRVLEPWSRQSIYFEMCICCFSVRHHMIKEQEQILVGSEWDVSERYVSSSIVLLWQLASAIRIHLNVLVWYKPFNKILNLKEQHKSLHLPSLLLWHQGTIYIINMYMFQY
jgi:hypothetical protein